MARFFLTLTFFAAAVAVFVPKVLDQLGLEQTRFLFPILYLPAAILGVRSWLKVQSLARSLPVLACVAVIWIELVRTFKTQGPLVLEKEFRTVALLTIVLPIAALIVERRYWWYAVKVFVLSTAGVLAFALVSEYGMDATDLKSLAMHRFGLIYGRDGLPLVNPNQLGSQFALAAILAFLLHLRGSRLASPGAKARPPAFAIGWTLFLSLGCLLTASRTAFVSWLAGMAIVFIWGTKAQPLGKIRDLAVQGTLLLLFAVAVATAGSDALWGGMYNRLAGAQSDDLSSLGGRLPIWQTVYEVWRSKPTYTYFGVGMGMVDEVLGQYDDLCPVADSFGSMHRDTHNTFLNWLLSYGLFGVIPGAYLAGVLVVRARQLDRAEGMANRQAILATVFLFSMGGVVYDRFYWLAVAPLVLAMLSPGGPVRRQHLPLPPGEGRGEGEPPRMLDQKYSLPRMPLTPCPSPGGRGESFRRPTVPGGVR